jgi:hypothetical protein
MPVDAKQVKQSMEDLLLSLKSKLDELSNEIFLLLPNGRLKYGPDERAELNNVRAKLVQEIFHRELIAAFDEASVQAVTQPTQGEVEALQLTLVKIGGPLDALNNHRAIVTFIEGIMTDTANRFNELTTLIKPQKVKGAA